MNKSHSHHAHHHGANHNTQTEHSGAKHDTHPDSRSDNTAAQAAGKNAPKTFMPSAEEFTEAAKRGGDAITRAFESATTGVNEICQVLTQYSQSLMELSAAAFQAAVKTQTFEEIAKVHHTYAKTSLELLLENGGRISEITVKAANNTAQPLQDHANDTMRKFTPRTAA